MTIVLATASPASAGSLYSGASHRPGPDILYRPSLTPPEVPQLQNTGIWSASPLLVSGATAYRNHEYLWQDWLYDDHGARVASDPNDSRTHGDLFSEPYGTYSYPTNRAYAENAADFVEVRFKRVSGATAIRVTLNTLKDPSLIAFTFALGNGTGVATPLPYGANVTAPADAFVTVHPSGSTLVGQVHNAALAPTGPASVTVDKGRRQIEVRVPDGLWTPSGTESIRGGIGLWDKATSTYLKPQPSRDASHPGGGTPASAAFFNVAFRRNSQEPFPNDPNGSQPGGLAGTQTDPRWWRDKGQGDALRSGSITAYHADVNFTKLAAGTNDDGGIPKTGPMDRILATHFEVAQGANWATDCLNSADPNSCPEAMQGRLQPYAIYVPRKGRPAGGYGMTLLLHSLSAPYNQFQNTRNESQFGERGPGSIVITPAARGPDSLYFGLGAVDVFEVWADVARRYKLDPAWSVITGYSMGGFGTFKLAEAFPDLFARAQPTVGYDAQHLIESLRNIPYLMWNAGSDELVPAYLYEQTAKDFDDKGYRYELDVFSGEHLTLAAHDQFDKAAAFLGTHKVNRNPTHVTFAADPAFDLARYNFVADHAYWLSRIRLRSKVGTNRVEVGGPLGPVVQRSDPKGVIDVFSHGFRRGDPKPSGTQAGGDTLSGGKFGSLAYSRQFKTWGAAPRIRKRNLLDIRANNVRDVSIAAHRARVRCNVALNVDTDGPITLRFPGCGRIVRLSCINARGRARGKRLGPTRIGRTRRFQRRLLKHKARFSRRGIDKYCVRGGGKLRIGYPTRRLSRHQRRLAKRREILVLTGSRRFSVRGIKHGSRTRKLRRRFHHERRLRIGRNVWYLARGRRATLIFKARRGKVLEVGIADRRLTRSRRASRRFLRSWRLR
ncbi:MAG: hypothetical protein ABR581_06065 [Thermoleophilaceae bacterium]